MAKGAREIIKLESTAKTGYFVTTVKNKKNTSDRLERNKYCPFCRKHTKHVETK